MNERRTGTVKRLGIAWALGVVTLGLVSFTGLQPGAGAGIVRAEPAATTAPPAPTPVKVGGRFSAEKACYVRLPDLPRPRYGMFGAINPKTGVLVAAGGAEKIGKTTLTYFKLSALKLNSVRSPWQEVLFGASEGYTRENKKGCREMASVRVSDELSLSVLGKGGCDHGRIDKVNRAGTDIQALRIGETPDPLGVSWVPNSGVTAFVDQLTTNGGALGGHFATWDSNRGRLIFGQGAFNALREPYVQDEVYAGTMVGSSIQLRKLDPLGPRPERRTGSCGAYVYDAATGFDGVIVVGGKEGGPVGTFLRDFTEVWFLDFSKQSEGEWKNITSRFSNMKDLGPRNGGVCSYDSGTKSFYSFMGRASSSMASGGFSNGLWRVSLAQLADPATPFTWERLAKDNLPAIKGRQAIPNVWDPEYKRFFVLGGSQSSTQYQDVWAVYPDITGPECLSLNPYTASPGLAPEPEVVDPNAARVCRQIVTQVDVDLISAALATPDSVPGWLQPSDPTRPVGPDNPVRTWLSLDNPFARYHPYFNRLIFRSGCP